MFCHSVLYEINYLITLCLHFFRFYFFTCLHSLPSLNLIKFLIFLLLENFSKKIGGLFENHIVSIFLFKN